MLLLLQKLQIVILLSSFSSSLNCKVALHAPTTSNSTLPTGKRSCNSQSELLHKTTIRRLLGPALRSSRIIADVTKNLKRTQQTKSHLRLPWVCQADFVYRDLGADYYPRYIRTAQCSAKSCWVEHYTCKPNLYKVKVLRRRNTPANNDDKCIDENNQWLPEQLRSVWSFEDITVTLCCECSP